MPRRPCSYFTGREALLGTLAERLRPGSAGPATIALCGPAGIGKSETARAFVHRHGRRYAAIEWVRAGNERQLAAGYGRIVERRGSPAGQLEPRDRVHAWLETFPDWLLVLDGVPNPKVLKGYLPAAGIGSVLITSRYAARRGRGRALSVGPLAPHEAVVFLLARTGQSDADAARVIAEELGGLPLALEEAAAHCREGAIPLSQYARRLQEDLESALSLGVSSSTGLRTVARVWTASLRSISETSPGAYDLLRHQPDEKAVSHPPTDFLHILVPVIVVKDGSGRHLVLQPLSYDEEHPGGPPPGGGFWALPHKDYRIAHRGVPPMTVGAVRRILDKAQEPDTILTEQAEEVAWQLGLTEPIVEFLPSMTVLKPSIRVPGQWLAIRFHFFRARSENDAGRRNLADREALRGLVHLPLDNLDEEIMLRRHRDGEEWWYGGKPIAFEVQLLLASDRRTRLLERPVRLDAEHFTWTDTGVIVLADLAGWGAALQAAQQPRNAIGVDRASNVGRFLDHSNAALHRFISRIGPTYEQQTGDGILAVFPERGHDQHLVVRRLVPAWMDVLQDVEALNRDLGGTAVIGSRLAVHFGPYLYGRMGQARSRNASVAGESIVEAARLEQGLAELVRREGGAARTDGRWRHTLAVSEEAMVRHGDVLAELGQGTERMACGT